VYPLATNCAFNRSSEPSGLNLTVYTHLQLIVFLPGERGTKSKFHSNARPTISTSMAFLQPRSNTASCVVLGIQMADMSEVKHGKE